jgi:hypothetical protein
VRNVDGEDDDIVVVIMIIIVIAIVITGNMKVITHNHYVQKRESNLQFYLIYFGHLK